MARSKVFISYSRAEKKYLDEVLPVLQAAGRQKPVSLKDSLGAHSPNGPFTPLAAGARDTISAKLANGVPRQLAIRPDTPPRRPNPLPRRPGQRFELAITLRARRDHW